MLSQRPPLPLLLLRRLLLWLNQRWIWTRTSTVTSMRLLPRLLPRLLRPRLRPRLRLRPRPLPSRWLMRVSIWIWIWG